MSHDGEQEALVVSGAQISDGAVAGASVAPRSKLIGAFIPALFNLTLSSIGAGLLSFPYAFLQSGLIPSLFWCVVFALINGWSDYVLFHFTAHAAKVNRRRKEVAPGNYEKVVEIILGRKYANVATGCVLVMIIGACIGYFIIIADMGQPLLARWWGDHWYSTRWFLIIVFATTIAFPLANLRSISELGHSSVLAIAAIVVVSVGVIVRGCQDLDLSRIQMVNWNVSMLETLPICMFAYGNTLTVAPIWNELSVKNRRRTTQLFTGSLTVCLFTYTLVGVFGYLRFGADTDGDILSNYDTGDTLMNVSRAIMALHVILAYPVLLFPGRRVIRMLIFRRPEIAGPAPLLEHTIHTALIVAFTAAIAIAVPQVSVVFGILGGSTGTALGIVFPALMIISPAGIASGYSALPAASSVAVTPAVTTGSSGDSTAYANGYQYQPYHVASKIPPAGTSTPLHHPPAAISDTSPLLQPPPHTHSRSSQELQTAHLQASCGVEGVGHEQEQEQEQEDLQPVIMSEAEIANEEQEERNRQPNPRTIRCAQGTIVAAVVFGTLVTVLSIKDAA